MGKKRRQATYQGSLEAKGGQDIGDRCDLGLPLDESTAREERHAQAIVRSLRTIPYCS
jgi:hypothetical protein